MQARGNLLHSVHYGIQYNAREHHMKLSDIAGSLTCTPTEGRHRNESYTVRLLADQYLAMTVGHTFGHPGWTFAHRNVVATHTRIMSFKRYLPSGAKRWDDKAGIERVLVIPLDRIELNLPTSGLSYVGVGINGVKVKLNVSGGTLGNGWEDVVTQSCATLVNYSKRVVRALADAAYSPDECHARGITVAAASESAQTKSRIEDLVAVRLGIKALPPGATVIFAPGLTAGGRPIETGTLDGRALAKTRRLLVTVGSIALSAQSRHIDWKRTLSANEVMPAIPQDVALCPANAPILAAA